MVGSLHAWANAARRTSPRLRSRFSRRSPCVPAPVLWALWPRFNLDGSSGGNVIVVRFDLFGMATACMAVSS
jgi:hypothetical protein